MRLYNGGSDKDQKLNEFTGNAFPLMPITTSTGNQMFISYTTTSNGTETSKELFSASFGFGKNMEKSNFLGIYCKYINI